MGLLLANPTLLRFLTHIRELKAQFEGEKVFLSLSSHGEGLHILQLSDHLAIFWEGVWKVSLCDSSSQIGGVAHLHVIILAVAVCI